jgi:hypothetical protein
MHGTTTLAFVSALLFAAAAGCYGSGEIASTDTAITPTGNDAGTADTGSAPAAGVDVFGGPVTCTSGKTSTSREGLTMRPGEACIACHMSGEGTIFQIAGTVYPTGHEPNDCVGSTTTDIKVIITDATGTEYPLTPNSVGNFTYGGGRSGGSLQFPYSARVERGGKIVEAMGAKQTNGDCNSCHTATGANGAPGRIAAPLPP